VHIHCAWASAATAVLKWKRMSECVDRSGACYVYGLVIFFKHQDDTNSKEFNLKMQKALDASKERMRFDFTVLFWRF